MAPRTPQHCSQQHTGRKDVAGHGWDFIFPSQAERQRFQRRAVLWAGSGQEPPGLPRVLRWPQQMLLLG